LSRPFHATAAPSFSWESRQTDWNILPVGDFPDESLASAVSIFEKDYPNLTFVISDLGFFDTDMPAPPGSPFATWPVPSLARAKGTWLGALDLGHFLPPPTLIDEACNVHRDFPTELQKPMEDLVDAFLYIGPQDLRLRDQMPADIALDIDYRLELQRRDLCQDFLDQRLGR
jgi:hypothetical protein